MTCFAMLNKTLATGIVLAFTMVHSFFPLSGQPDEMYPNEVLSKCQKDFESLKVNAKCSHDSHEQTMVDCLLNHENQLTKDCKEEISEHKKSWENRQKSYENVRKICQIEIEKLKIKDQPHKASMVAFMSHAKIISPSCKKVLNDHISQHMPGIKQIP